MSLRRWGLRRYHNFRLTLEIARWWNVDPERATDALHREGAWDFDAAEERARFARVREAAARARGPAPWGDVLEIGCSEGAFTRELAPLARAVTACDVSGVACARAAETCAPFPNVRVLKLDLLSEPIPGAFDLVFAMDVLSFVHGRRTLDAVAGRIRDALRPGGILVFCEVRLPESLEESWWVRRCREGGLQQARHLAAMDGLAEEHREFFDCRVPHVLSVLRRTGVAAATT